MTNHFLKNDSKLLHGLFQKLAELQELNQIFAHYMEEGIVAHCQVANLQNNCLIVIVDSGNWATQLRFHIPDLIPKLRQHEKLANLKSICCKTRPNHMLKATPKKQKSQMKRISQEIGVLIRESAKNIQDEKIRSILERIANRKSD